MEINFKLYKRHLKIKSTMIQIWPEKYEGFIKCSRHYIADFADVPIFGEVPS